MAVTQKGGPGSKVAITQATSAVIEPTERSIPPDMRMAVMPNASTRIGAAPMMRSLKYQPAVCEKFSNESNRTPLSGASAAISTSNKMGSNKRLMIDSASSRQVVCSDSIFRVVTKFPTEHVALWAVFNAQQTQHV